MKQFTALAVIAAAAAAEYQPWEIKYDGDTITTYVRSQNFSDATATGTDLWIDDNNNVFLQSEPYDGADYSFKPDLRGGMIEYDLDMSYNDCGCVSSLYLVAKDNQWCSQDAQTDDDVHCPSIDIMQGNNFGFNVGANPCGNGTCDAISQCMYDMRTEGAAEYGEGAYGPGGSLINTFGVFHVKTEFLSTEDYATFWGMRTRITQGENEIVMEKACEDYLGGNLSEFINGGMSLVFSSWDNRDGQGADFENGQCTEPMPDCDAAYSTFSNFQVQSYGYNEAPPTPPGPTPPGPTPPGPEPSTFENFVAFTDQEYYAPAYEMYVRGLPGKALSTGYTTILMGEENRAFVTDAANDYESMWAYGHDLLGGSFNYTVDVSNVGCACAAGAFFVDLNDEECSWNAKDEDVTPQCASIEIMEANIYGFNVASNPCEFGSCDIVSQCRANITTDSDVGGTEVYGYGSGYSIDTSMPYKVSTKFWANQDVDGMAIDLAYIETILEQEDRVVTMMMDCPEYLQSMTWKLYYGFNFGMSTYNLEQNNDVSGGYCDTACSNTQMNMKDLTWSSNDSMIEYDAGELVWGGPAPLLNSGNCLDDCTECREFWYDNDPTNLMYECVDRVQYKFGAGCNASKSRDSCMTDETFCVNSWDIDDSDKWNSPLAKCRTIPYSYIIDDQADWKFGRNECKNNSATQCMYGCGDGICKNSWPMTDALKWNSALAQCRCKY